MQKRVQIVLDALAAGAEHRDSTDGKMVKFSVPRAGKDSGEIRWPVGLLLGPDEARIRAVALAIQEEADRTPDRFVAIVKPFGDGIVWVLL